MNRLSIERRAHLLGLLVEGNSLRSVTRIADVSINTVTKLLVEVGEACAAYHDEHVRNVRAQRVQCDEIWAFVYAKQKNVTAKIAETHADTGDIWTWTALDADSKLLLSWRLGPRDARTAYEFMNDLAGRLANRVQLTTDGHKPYLAAVEDAFGCEIDYSMLVRLYGSSGDVETRYSPAKIIGVRSEVILGDPNRKHISTSYVERQNLTMRMSMRRFGSGSV